MGPGELQPQVPQLRLRCPKVPAELLARIVGFFRTIARRHGAEAVVLLACDESDGRVVPIVPPQIATVGWGWSGEPYPVGLHYEIPPSPGPGLKLFGDIHSHAFEPAYASSVDVADETHWPGVHVVAGRLHRDPPEWHAACVVDGCRFKVGPEAVLELGEADGGSSRFDPEWLDRVRVVSAAEFARRRQERNEKWS